MSALGIQLPGWGRCGGAAMDPELRSRERTIIRTPMMIIIIVTITA